MRRDDTSEAEDIRSRTTPSSRHLWKAGAWLLGSACFVGGIWLAATGSELLGELLMVAGILVLVPLTHPSVRRLRSGELGWKGWAIQGTAAALCVPATVNCVHAVMVRSARGQSLAVANALWVASLAILHWCVPPKRK
ncbi:MAG: hypothetical protein ACE5O2_00315 [Armatimonadota bacterium]